MFQPLMLNKWQENTRFSECGINQRTWDFKTCILYITLTLF